MVASVFVAVCVDPFLGLLNGAGLGGEKLDGVNVIVKTIFVPMITAPLFAAMGYSVGITADVNEAPSYTLELKAALFVCLLLSIVIFIMGFRKRKNLWGKALNALGFYLWRLGGLISLAPST